MPVKIVRIAGIVRRRAENVEFAKGMRLHNGRGANHEKMDSPLACRRLDDR
jgi:hypothetical protein